MQMTVSASKPAATRWPNVTRACNCPPFCSLELLQRGAAQRHLCAHGEDRAERAERENLFLRAKARMQQMPQISAGHDGAGGGDDLWPEQKSADAAAVRANAKVLPAQNTPAKRCNVRVIGRVICMKLPPLLMIPSAVACDPNPGVAAWV